MPRLRRATLSPHCKAVALVLPVTLLLCMARTHLDGAANARQLRRHAFRHVNDDTRRAHGVLVSYAYFEKDSVQRHNLDFFLSVGVGLDERGTDCRRHAIPADVTITVADGVCRPCLRMERCMRQVSSTGLSGLSKAMHQTHSTTSRSLTLLYRRDNVGMDFASHNVTLSWARLQRATYRFFIFLNSSVRGPFVPSYLPPGWHWTRAFTDKLAAGHSLVACSLTCLPHVDAGGPGPRAESWAFALDGQGLAAAQRRDVFDVRDCKLCSDGIVVAGEYGLSKAVLDAKLSMSTLLYRYRDNVDWSDAQHWHCNNNAHPSRQGTYGGISQHPFEILFVKASWGVGEPYTSTYTDWAAKKMALEDTKGAFDFGAYKKAIS